MQCPGCLTYVFIRGKKNKPPKMIDIETGVVHKCKEIKKLRKDIKNLVDLDMASLDDDDYKDINSIVSKFYGI